MEACRPNPVVNIEECAVVHEQQELPAAVVVRVLGLLPPNETACTARLLNKDICSHFSSPNHRTIHHSQRIPAHAFVWRYGAPHALRALSFSQKELLVALTASSGAVDNMQLLYDTHPDSVRHLLGRPATLTAAVTGGRAACVRWLTNHAPEYDQHALLHATLQHGTLAEAQGRLAGLLAAGYTLQPLRVVTELVGAAAACAAADDAVGKLEWLEGVEGLDLHAAMDLSTVEAAAEAGNLAAVRWLVARRCAHEVRAIVLGAALSGSLDMLSWVLDRSWPGKLHHVGCLYLPAACQAAARRGHVAVLRALLPPAMWAAAAALEPGYFDDDEDEGEDEAAPPAAEILGRTAEEYVDDPDDERAWRAREVLEDCCAAAADGGQLEALAALWPLGPRRPGLLLRLASSGRVEAVRWLWGRLAEQAGGDPEAGALLAGEATLALRRAVAEGLLPMVAFLREEAGAAWAMEVGGYEPPGYAWPPERLLPCSAALGGASAVAALEWLHAAGCPLECGGEELKGVLAAGDLPALRWLHARGMAAAADLAAGGRHESLSPLAAAAEGGCEAMLELLVERGCDPEGGSEGYVAAAGRGDLDTLRCLRRLGVPWGGVTVERAVRAAPWGCAPDHCMGWGVRWMVEGGAPYDARELADNLRMRRVWELAEWVGRQGKWGGRDSGPR